VELAPGDADAAPAVGTEDAVASAITLEGGPRAVGTVTVELNDERVLAPHAVAFEPEQWSVHLRQRQTGGT
jgi:hypothetical protein